jgi:hypothetical protein
MCPMWGSFEPRMMIFPFLFMIVFCVFMFFMFRCCRPFAWWGTCSFPHTRQDDDYARAAESNMNTAEEISKLKKEIQELKDILRKN